MNVISIIPKYLPLIATVLLTGCIPIPVDTPPIASGEFPYHFDREPYVNPRIVEELNGTLADLHPSVVAIDLMAANASNRFPLDYTTRDFNGTLVEYEREPGHGQFFYRHIARTLQGLDIVYCADSGGGSGTFVSLLFLKMRRDTAMDAMKEGGSERERVLLEMVGSVALGDRYDGKIEYADGVLTIGPDESMMKHGGRVTEQKIVVE
jgi:hypothetical protein